jgi:hypothetical protein
MSKMTLTEKIAFLYDKKYTDALGCGHSDPDKYAADCTAELRATLKAVEYRQAHPNGLPQAGSRAGRRQAAERR